jgi:hypothetical protein
MIMVDVLNVERERSTAKSMIIGDLLNVRGERERHTSTAPAVLRPLTHQKPSNFGRIVSDNSFNNYNSSTLAKFPTTRNLHYAPGAALPTPWSRWWLLSM